jgi:hypothetical protein
MPRGRTLPASECFDGNDFAPRRVTEAPTRADQGRTIEAGVTGAEGLDIDDELLRQAQRILGAVTKKETVNRALREVVRRDAAARFLTQASGGVFGTVPHGPTWRSRSRRCWSRRRSTAVRTPRATWTRSKTRTYQMRGRKTRTAPVRGGRFELPNFGSPDRSTTSVARSRTGAPRWP